MLGNLKDKHKIWILSGLICVTLVFGFFQYRKVQKLEYAQEIEYNRVFAELTGYVDDLEISLLKGQLVNSPQQMARLSADLYRQASGAKASLALLPISEVQLEKTSEFLSQVGEYATAISAKMLGGEKMTQKELQTMQNLSSYAKQMKSGFDEILTGINDGRVSFVAQKRKLEKLVNGKSVALANELEALEEEFHDYPSLVYDGPFSQHLNLKRSIFAKGKAEISESQALKNAKSFTGDSQCQITQLGGILPSYNIKCGETTIEYTKNGGILLLLMKNRQPDGAKLTIDQARSKALEFLNQNGFDQMKETYYENREGSIVINYAYNQDDYVVYPDLVKVKVALDNGEIIGFESRGYIMNHLYREIPAPKITKEEAMANINEGLSVQSVTMAVVPLENGSEACCYQLQGAVLDRNFLVFVNTQTGGVEDIQILIETPGGTLAV